MKNTIILLNKNLPNQPVIIYDNAEIDKLRILSDNKDLSGIYMWTHKESGKIYIGSAFNLSKRLKDYYSSYYLKRSNYYICNALIYYSHSDFSLSILEYIDILNLSEDKAKNLILEREQNYLDLLQPEFNILKKAGSSLGFKHSNESLAKMSIAKKGENHPMFGITSENHPMFGKTHELESLVKMSEAKKGENNPMFGIIGENSPMFGRTGENHPMFGKTHSTETKALLSKANKGENNPMFGKTHKEETIVKMSIAKGGNTIYVYDSQGLLINTFSSTRKAALHFKVNHKTIIKYLRCGLIFQNKWLLSPFLKEE
jgi:group I intron endonuclease